MSGLGVVLLLATLALGSSYLANDRPILLRKLVKAPGATAATLRVSFPAWDSCPKPERLAQAWVLALGCFWLGRRIARRVSARPLGGPAAARIALGLLLAGVAVPILWSKDRLDTTDYPRLATKLKAEQGEFALFPPIRYSPYGTDLDSIYQTWSRTHWLGTDNVGRDLFTRILHGTKISLCIGLVAVAIELLIGITLGALAGYFARGVDLVISRIIEVFMCFPTMFLLITIVAFLPRNIFVIMAVIGITGWTPVARLIRGEFLKVRKQDYVAAAQALGASHLRTMFRHILPNAIAPALVSATFGIAGAILAESTLTFLGFGVDPSTPTWGEALHEAWENYRNWWLAVFPGLAIFITVTAYNLVGEGLRDAIDPRLKT
ncbi:MAG: ABC transporter permease [Planctomycetes bacterium]|nr:ABC transporter permease [Planctomycetota bacterium]